LFSNDEWVTTDLSPVSKHNCSSMLQWSRIYPLDLMYVESEISRVVCWPNVTNSLDIGTKKFGGPKQIQGRAIRAREMGPTRRVFSMCQWNRAWTRLARHMNIFFCPAWAHTGSTWPTIASKWNGKNQSWSRFIVFSWFIFLH
jgi:hypothetical protein